MTMNGVMAVTERFYTDDREGALLPEFVPNADSPHFSLLCCATLRGHLNNS